MLKKKNSAYSKDTEKGKYGNFEIPKLDTFFNGRDS